MLRQVIKIDEELCNGCGDCVPACAEGAIQIIDGKAKLVADKYCDGLGACLGDCPTGAISFEEREAEEFDEAAVMEHLDRLGRDYDPHAHDHLGDKPAHPAHAIHAGGGCPSARTLDFRSDARQTSDNAPAPQIGSELRQWPVKLYLVNPGAPYFQDADLLVAADCVPFAYPSLHPDFLRGKALVIGCPKFDDLDLYLNKLTAIVSGNNIRSITVLHMEVPCCFGLMQVAREAVAAAGKDIPVQAKVVTLRGEIQDPLGLASLF
ncbi:MAG: 4Fe-4S binding protein [Armatimonadetes bacterium]|nr:4Fe-4S binding protein [Armatimonadota bacterium]